MKWLFICRCDSGWSSWHLSPASKSWDFFLKPGVGMGGNIKLFKLSYRLYPTQVYIYVSKLTKNMQSFCASKEQKAHSSTQLKIRHPPPPHPPQFFCLFSETFNKHEARLFVLSMSAIPEQCYSGSCVFPHGMYWENVTGSILHLQTW